MRNGALCCKCGQVSTITWKLNGNSSPYKSGYACLRFLVSAVGVCSDAVIYIETESTAEQGSEISKFNDLANDQSFLFSASFMTQ